MRLMWCAWMLMVFASASVAAHPHHEPEIFVLWGTLTKVDLVNKAIELDTFDPTTRAPRNLLLFLDKKVKLRNGKAKLDVTELKPGQRVICTVEREPDEGGADRMVAFEIQLRPRT